MELYNFEDKGNLTLQNKWPLEFRNLYHGYRERNSSKKGVLYVEAESAAHDGLPEKHEKRRVSKLNRDQCINTPRGKIMQ